MTDAVKTFGVNTYAYTLRHSALDCVNRLGEHGYPGIELMMYPGHLWPEEVDAAGRRALRQAAQAQGMRIVSVNMPNVDLNIAGASQEMRAYSLDRVSQFVRLGGELEAPFFVLGPGKANPLFAAPREQLLGHFFAALDRLCPIAADSGIRLLVENMPFAFLPQASAIVAALDAYGDDRIGVIYDVANAHFIGEDPCDGLRLVKDRLGLVHFSDTGRALYKHDPVGMGDVPFAAVPSVLAEIGYAEMPVLEIISHNPDADIRDSAKRLARLGYTWSAAAIRRAS